MWQTIREKRTALLAVAGFVVLMLYGVIPTLQPRAATFSRVYAVYGGVFIVLSYIWGLVVDGVRPDRFDYAGAGMALAGVALAWFAPRAAPPVQSTEQVTIPPPPPP